MKKYEADTQETTSKGLTRRKFVETTAIAGAAVAAVPFLGGKAPAYAQARKVHYLQWTSFVPAADAEIDRQAEEFTKATGIEMTVEKINQNDMAARITAAVESGSGADVIQMNANQPHLFAGGLADHDELLQEILGDEVYEWAFGAATVDGVARGVPAFNIGNAVVYRKDVFEELGLQPPNTWDEYLEVGRALKNNNLPVGQTLGHTFGDAPTFAYPLLWSFGGQEVDGSGKVVINSEGTHKALAFIKDFWEAACDPGGFAWDDTSNNRAFLGQTIGATLNGASIYFVREEHPGPVPGAGREAQPLPQSGGPVRPVPFRRPAHAQHHELLAEQGGGRRIHPLDAPGRQLQRVHDRERRLYPGRDAEVGESPGLAVRSGDRDLRGPTRATAGPPAMPVRGTGSRARRRRSTSSSTCSPAPRAARIPRRWLPGRRESSRTSTAHDVSRDDVNPAAAVRRRRGLLSRRRTEP